MEEEVNSTYHLFSTAQQNGPQLTTWLPMRARWIPITTRGRYGRAVACWPLHRAPTIGGIILVLPSGELPLHYLRVACRARSMLPHTPRLHIPHILHALCLRYTRAYLPRRTVTSTATYCAWSPFGRITTRALQHLPRRRCAAPPLLPSQAVLIVRLRCAASTRCRRARRWQPARFPPTAWRHYGLPACNATRLRLTRHNRARGGAAAVARSMAATSELHLPYHGKTAQHGEKPLPWREHLRMRSCCVLCAADARRNVHDCYRFNASLFRARKLPCSAHTCYLTHALRRNAAHSYPPAHPPPVGERAEGGVNTGGDKLALLSRCERV